MDWKKTIIAQIEKPLKELNIEINSQQKEQICAYYEKLKLWNTVMNLTAIVDEIEFSKNILLIVLHQVDLLIFLKSIQ